MTTLFRGLFFLILLVMFGITTLASLDRNIYVAIAELWPDPWFRATLADAYFGFFVIYIWIAYRERFLALRLMWFVLVMGLGNIAIAVYILRCLFQLRPGQSIEQVLLRGDA